MSTRGSWQFQLRRSNLGEPGFFRTTARPATQGLAPRYSLVHHPL
jgi:hypothetical protein